MSSIWLRLMPRLDSWMATGTIWLLAAAPVLFFPGIAPTTWMANIVSVAGLGAIGFAIALIRPFRNGQRWTALFGLAVTVSWLWNGVYSIDASSHFGGTALGMLAMAVVARLYRTTIPPLVLLAGTALLGLGVMAAGTIAVSPHSLVRAPVKFGWLGDALLRALAYLPNYSLPLQGLAHGGFVNPNALGGISVMILPLVAVWFWLPRYLTSPATRIAAWALALSGTGLAALTLLISGSRTAVGALVFVLLLILVSLRRGVGIALVVLAALAVGVGLVKPDCCSSTIGSITSAADERSAYWSVAVQMVAKSPWTGIGFSQFNSPVTAALLGAPWWAPPAHAHNIALQIALDVGVIGLIAYVGLLCSTVAPLRGRHRWATPVDRIIASAAVLSLALSFLFGTFDAIALGAKVGLFQWLALGLLIGASSPSASSLDNTTGER